MAQLVVFDNQGSVKVNAYDKPFNYLLASPFWSPKTMWMEVPL